MARRPSPTAQPRWAKRPVIPRQAKRPTLTEKDVDWLRIQMRKHYKWSSDPRFFQLEGVKAQLEGVDMIIQAPTGAGKTAIAAGPHLWPASEGKVTIMVCPLLALEEEMVDTFSSEFGLKAVAVNSAGGTLTQTVVDELIGGTYQILLISPEMLQSPSFINRVLRKSEFSRRVLSLFIDEAHCVSHWGANFRKKYGSLGTVRAFLPRGTPVIAVTATLTERVRRDLHHVLHFPKFGSRFVNVGNDRPNVSIVVRAMEHAQNSYADLDFIIPPSVTTPTDIPKTYLYVDDIKAGTEIIDYLSNLLDTRSPHLARCGLIRPFNASMDHAYRRNAMEAFRYNPPTNDESGPRSPAPAPTHKDSAEVDENAPACIRILVCTDAAGMGCNVKDVDIVVQWKLPKTLSSFVQRAGRAARSPARRGIAVLLVERSIYSQDLRPSTMSPKDDDAPRTGKGKATRSKKSTTKTLPKGYAQRHGQDRGGTARSDQFPAQVADEEPVLDPDAADEGLRVLVQSRTCRRQSWATVFQSYTNESVSGVPCCDICDSTLFDRVRPGQLRVHSKSRLRAKGRPDLAAYDRLEEWRESVFYQDMSSSQLDPDAILDNATILSLVSVGRLNATQVAHVLKDSWTWWDKYGEQLSALVNSLDIIYTPLPKKATARKPGTTPALEASSTTGASACTAEATQKRKYADVAPPAADPEPPSKRRSDAGSTNMLSSTPVAMSYPVPSTPAPHLNLTQQSHPGSVSSTPHPRYSTPSPHPGSSSLPLYPPEASSQPTDMAALHALHAAQVAAYLASLPRTAPTPLPVQPAAPPFPFSQPIPAPRRAYFAAPQAISVGSHHYYHSGGARDMQPLSVSGTGASAGYSTQPASQSAAHPSHPILAPSTLSPSSTMPDPLLHDVGPLSAPPGASSTHDGSTRQPPHTPEQGNWYPWGW